MTDIIEVNGIPFVVAGSLDSRLKIGQFVAVQADVGELTTEVKSILERKIMESADSYNVDIIYLPFKRLN